MGATLDEVADGIGRFRPAFGRFERIPAGDRTVLLLLVKNPAGANEVVRTLTAGGPPRVVVAALNDGDRGRQGCLVDLGRRLRAACSTAWIGSWRPVPGPQELALRFKYGGLDPSAIEVVPGLERALDRGLELTPAGGELVVLPTYTAMLALRRIVAERGLVRPYWEGAAA